MGPFFGWFITVDKSLRVLICLTKDGGRGGWSQTWTYCKLSLLDYLEVKNVSVWPFKTKPTLSSFCLCLLDNHPKGRKCCSWCLLENPFLSKHSRQGGSSEQISESALCLVSHCAFFLCHLLVLQERVTCHIQETSSNSSGEFIPFINMQNYNQRPPCTDLWPSLYFLIWLFLLQDSLLFLSLLVEMNTNVCVCVYVNTHLHGCAIYACACIYMYVIYTHICQKISVKYNRLNNLWVGAPFLSRTLRSTRCI